MSGMHSHRCKNCGVIWHHSDEMRGNVVAHKCPACGKMEWEQFNHAGDQLPHEGHGGRGPAVPAVYAVPAATGDKILNAVHVVAASVLLVCVVILGGIAIVRGVAAIREEIGALKS